MELNRRGRNSRVSKSATCFTGGSSTTPQQGHIQPQSASRIGVLRATNIEATTFELPAENIKYLDGIWLVLNPPGSLELRYTDPNGFAANGLRAASGELGASTR